MNHSTRSGLLEDVLAPPSLAESLAATRRAARCRRMQRRALPAASLICTVFAGGWLLFQRVGVISQPSSVAVALAPAPAPAPAFVVVRTAPQADEVVVRTDLRNASCIVSTYNATRSTPRASEDDLFALAGPRPAALHRLPDGSARWMWLDEKRRF